jgi:hypothetical protein
MPRPSHVILVTLALGVGGFVLGTMAIGVGGALGLLMEPSRIGQALLGIQALLGGVLGAVVLPVIAWAALRRVPLWQLLVGPSTGAVLGTALEWVALDQGTFGGAAVGVATAVVWLARSYHAESPARQRHSPVRA